VRKAWPILNPGRQLLWGDYHTVITEHLEAVALGQISHLLLLLPPGTTKSTIVTVCYPAWRWASKPSVRFLVASNETSIAARDSMACRNLIRSAWYAGAYMHDRDGNTLWYLCDDQNEKEWYATTATGHRQAVTVAKTVSGKKGDELITDDPNDAAKVHSAAERRNVKRWYGEAFYNRVDDFKSARHIMIGQHTHVDDLQSDQLKQGGWVVVALPEQGPHAKYNKTAWFVDSRGPDDWLRPERFGPAEAAAAQKKMGPLAYSAQHQQKPTNPEGRMFDRAKVTIVPTYPHGTQAVRYWDTAASTGETACFSSGVLQGRTPDGRPIIMDVTRGRLTPADRNRLMRTTSLLDMRLPGVASYRMYWEKGASDSGVERDANLLAYFAGIPCEADPAKGDKQMRAEPLSSQWAGGNVLIVEGDWNADYLDEMEAFPDQPIKDSVDASSGGFNRLAELSSSDVEPGTAADEDTELGRLPPGTFSNRRGVI
jgi:predicted phage terminase large subunit-like protein